jgi:murein DD-endopeptidase MepM/ murein hydrolase activator NlpD
MSRHLSISSVLVISTALSAVVFSFCFSPGWCALSTPAVDSSSLEMQIGPKAPVASNNPVDQNVADTSTLLNQAAQILAEQSSKHALSSGKAVESGSGDEPMALNANSFITATQNTVKKKSSLPKDEDILDEPWSIYSASGIIVNEDGMVLPHTSDFGHQFHNSPVKRLSMNPAATAASLQNFFRFILPVHNALVTSPFGFRWGRPHQGIDMAAPMGSPIHAAQAGRVIYSSWKQGYGNFIVIDHGHGLHTHYAHCSRILTHLGQTVQKGDLIGRVGSTGNSTGPHLHFEVLAQGVHRNPLPYLNRGASRLVTR